MLRDELEKNVINLNMSIAAYQQMADYYTSRDDAETDWWVKERITKLYSIMAEYQVAVILATEEAQAGNTARRDRDKG